MMRMQGRSSAPLRGDNGHAMHNKIETPPSMDSGRCQEHPRVAPNHDAVLRDDDIPQPLWSWDEDITDLISGILLELPPM